MRVEFYRSSFAGERNGVQKITVITDNACRFVIRFDHIGAASPRDANAHTSTEGFPFATYGEYAGDANAKTIADSDCVSAGPNEYADAIGFAGRFASTDECPRNEHANAQCESITGCNAEDAWDEYVWQRRNEYGDGTAAGDV